MATPSRLSLFFRLPLELILEITERLPPQAMVNFIFANYALLHYFGLVPAMSPEQLSRLVDESRLDRIVQRLIPLPVELLLQMMENLSPRDTLMFVLANYRDLALRGIAPALSDDTISALRRTSLETRDRSI